MIKHELPNHMKLNKKDRKEFKLIKERIKSMTLLEWFFVGLIFSFTILLSFLIFK